MSNANIKITRYTLGNALTCHTHVAPWHNVAYIHHIRSSVSISHTGQNQ